MPENFEKTQKDLQMVTAERDRLLAEKKQYEENAIKSKNMIEQLQLQSQSLNNTCDKLTKDLDELKFHYKEEMALR